MTRPLASIPRWRRPSRKRAACWNATYGSKADPDNSARDVWAAIKEIPDSDLSDRSKNSAIQALFEQTKKRGGKPTRHYRDNALHVAAENLVAQGYDPTRSDATRHRESASSIIREALRRLGVKMKEKQINSIMLNSGGGVPKYPD